MGYFKLMLNPDFNLEDLQISLNLLLIATLTMSTYIF